MTPSPKKARKTPPEPSGRARLASKSRESRKRTGTAVRERLQDLRYMATVVSDSNDAVIVHDFDGKILAWNRGAREVYGYTEAEALGWNVREIVAEPDREAALKLIQRIRQGEIIKSFELRRRAKDGRILEVWLTTTLLRNERGTPVAIASTERDITERKRAEERIQRQLHHLAALHTIKTAIAGSVDLGLTLSVALEHVLAQLDADAADVLLLNADTSTLEFAAGRGFRGEGIERSRLRLGEGHAGRAAIDQRTIHVSDLSRAIKDFVRAELFSSESFTTYSAVPLIAKGEVKGVLEVFFRKPHEAELDWLDFLETLARQVAIAVDNAQLFSGLQRSNADLSLAYDATVAGWSSAMDLRDRETEGHTQRVTEMCVNLARHFGLRENELVNVRRGGLLHDIGKMGVPDGILLKPGPLTNEEWVVMKKHPTFAYDMLAPIMYLQHAVDIPYCHHEKWDGSGYPRGLKGEQIPLVARIFSVVDVWDAVTSDRPYRPAWSDAQAVEHIKTQTGKHFDPQIAPEFLQMIGEG